MKIRFIAIMNLNISIAYILTRKNGYYCNRLFVSIIFKTVVFLLTFESFVTSDDRDNLTVFEPDVKYNTDYSLDNSSHENITDSNLNISYLDLDNKTISNESSFDVATELESSISVTEDSDDSFQAYRKHSLFLTKDEDICNCDLSTNICDINCCCDSDCTAEDQQVFSECSYTVLTLDDNYCYQQNIIIRNNTVYKMVKDPKNAMFCIVHDNFKHHLRFKDMPILRSHIDLSSVLKYKYQTTYSWDSESEGAFESNELKAGHPIYIQLSNNISNRWSLPSSCLSDLCSCHEKIHYLSSFKSSCSYVIEDLQKECEDNKILSGNEILNFCIASRSAPGYLSNSIADLIEHTKAVSSNSDIYDDYSSFQLCVNKNTLKPKKRFNMCENVVREIQFLVEHDGINGITKIAADFIYANISFNENIIIQTYSVNFVWSNISNVEKKSGNPGYQIGLPILAASNGSDTDSAEISLKQSYLSILDRDIDSFCSNNHQMIKFGKNLKSGCYLLNNFQSCKILQNRIFDILLGPSKKEIFIGIFGNANISNLNDWIEVFHEGLEMSDRDEKCFVSLGLKINIIYAAVGTVVNPQYKIVGVGYHYKKPQFIDFSCFPTCKNILLSTSVSFFDVTLPAARLYAKVPSIKANLPSDFFYPFLYGKSVKAIANVYIIICLYLLVWNIF